jgi:hypothetical protein
LSRFHEALYGFWCDVPHYAADFGYHEPFVFLVFLLVRIANEPTKADRLLKTDHEPTTLQGQ